jgi:hypothetical protein
MLRRFRHKRNKVTTPKINRLKSFKVIIRNTSTGTEICEELKVDGCCI